MIKFEGTSTALITPFLEGKLDFPSLKKLIKFQIDSGIEGFVVAGSTAEAATLTLGEKKQLLDFIIQEVAGEVPVLMGSGTFNTQETCELIKDFEKQKPDGFLVVTPYYNRPPQKGLLAHYEKVAQSTDLPIVIYNVPSRTACTIAPETVADIARKYKNVIGIKEAAGSLEVIKKLKSLCPREFLVLSGDDGTFIDAADLGAQGVISVISHVIPEWCVEACRKARQHQEVKAMTDKVKEMATILFCESNPIPLKWALKEMGIIRSAELRLPLLELDQKYHESVRATLKSWELVR